MNRLLRLVLLCYPLCAPLAAAPVIESNGVTWTLARDHSNGVYGNGDPWVVGPVTVVGIANTLNSPHYAPRPGQNGSMLNPGTDDRQGYDSTLPNYRPELNAALPGGRPVAPDNPIRLDVGTTLVSAVSWLYASPDDTEPGTPAFNGGTRTPRPALRSAGLLTVVAAPPPPNSFRPPYVGADKTARFRRDMIDYAKLPVLAPPAVGAPRLGPLADNLSRTWLDHVNNYLGGFTHPSEHMPNYGRDMARILGDATLALFTDGSAPGVNPDKDRLLVGLVQFGVDLAGIADHDGHWGANGGHCVGRKWPILLAGVLLDDAHLKNVGRWSTRFQEDEQTFYVSEETVALTRSSAWNPDKRAPRVPYTKVDIGMPEWGVTHAEKPAADNAAWQTPYRDVNGSVIPAFALAARLMGLKAAWNHEAFFDYCDRYMTWKDSNPPVANRPGPFLQGMWDKYRPGLDLPSAPASAAEPPRR